ncbi:DUF768 domain-containing protein [Mesorhizobium atlanticum]
MSERGAEFFGRWITDNVMRGSVGADIVSVAELTSKLSRRCQGGRYFRGGDRRGDRSAYEAILAAIASAPPAKP